MGKKCSIGYVIERFLDEQGNEVIASDNCQFHKMVMCEGVDVEGKEARAVNRLFNLGWSMLHLGEKLRCATKHKMKKHGELDPGHLGQTAIMIRRWADELDEIAKR